MKNTNQKNKPGHITRGDIFDDLGFSAADTLEAKVKADIWQALIEYIDRNHLSQSHLVSRLKAHQPDVSNLLKGKISRVSITRLIQYAGRLNLEATVKIAPSRAGNKLNPKAQRDRAEFITA